MKNRILGRVILETQKKKCPTHILSVYLGGINLSQYCLPHGFILHVYILGKTSPSLLLCLYSNHNQIKVKLELES